MDICTFNTIVQDSINLAKNSSLSNETLTQNINTIANSITSHVPHHCEDDTNLDKVDEILAVICKSMHTFDYLKFKETLKEFVNNRGNTTLSEVELDKLSLIILSTHEGLDEFLSKIDLKTKKDTIGSLRNVVSTLIDSPQNINYDSIMNILDLKFKRISAPYNYPSLQKLNSSEFIIKKLPNESFSIQIEDLLPTSDPTYIISFNPSSSILPINKTLPDSFGKISTTSFLLTGTAPSVLGNYSYSIPFTITTPQSSSNSTLLLTVFVCSSQYLCSPPSVLVLSPTNTTIETTDQSANKGLTATTVLLSAIAMPSVVANCILFIWISKLKGWICRKNRGRIVPVAPEKKENEFENLDLEEGGLDSNLKAKENCWIAEKEQSDVKLSDENENEDRADTLQRMTTNEQYSNDIEENIKEETKNNEEEIKTDRDLESESIEESHDKISYDKYVKEVRHVSRDLHSKVTITDFEE